MVRVGVLGGPPHAWGNLHDAEMVRIDSKATATRDIDVVLIDGASDSVVRELSGIRPTLPHVQPIIVVPDAHRASIQRAVTLSPGLGEVWIIEPKQLTDSLISEAAAITGQRRKYAALRRQTETPVARTPPVRRPVVTDAFLATVLQVAQVAVFSLDKNNRVLSANPAAERLFGVKERDVIGKAVLDVIHPREEPAAEWLLTRPDGHHRNMEFDLPDGRTGVFEIDVATVLNRAEPLRVVVAHDITELRRLMDTRSRFYAAMNHEIRTPINAILGFNDLLLAGVYGEPPEQIRDGIARSQRAAQHLLEIVNDVLDLSKIEAGRVDIAWDECQLPDVIRDLVQTMEPTMAAAGSAVTCELQCTDPVRTDERRVTQILMNLLSNAAKFGQGQPITVRCYEDRNCIRIDVIDRGIGIKPDELPRIFEEFVQLRERRQRGTGLGLAISQRLAGLIGGRLEAVSELGRGSTFSLLLPQA